MRKSLLRAFALMTVLLSSVNLFAQRTFQEGEKLYFKANAISWWIDANAVQELALVNYYDEADVWYIKGENVDEEGNYVFTIPSEGTFTTARFARLDPNGGGVWNMTGNIPLAGTEGKNYVKSFAQDSDVATWGTWGDAPDPDVTRTIYIVDETGWDAVAIYAWGTKDILGVWPGTQVNNKEKVTDSNGKEYYRFTVTGQPGSYNLIANNNGGGTQYDMTNISLNEDYAFILKADGWESIPVPENVSIVEVTRNFYIVNQTGWDAVALYAWGTKDIFGGWPGIEVTAQEIVSDDKYDYYKFTGTAQEGGEYNLIANNNNGGTQFDMLKVDMTTDYAFILTANGYEAIAIPDHTTGISNVTTTADAVAYNLHGMKVSAPAKGLYIVNGKKYIAK